MARPGFFRFAPALVLIAALGADAQAVRAETILERVLGKLAGAPLVSGVFVNVGDNGGTVSADVTSILSGGRFDVGRFVGDSGAAASPPLVVLGRRSVTTGLGAINDGGVVLGAGHETDYAATTLAAPVTGADRPFGTVPVGLDTLRDRVGEDGAAVARVAHRPIAGLVDGAVLAGNMAGNRARVSARVRTVLSGVDHVAADATTTALGAVNTGLTRVLGD